MNVDVRPGVLSRRPGAAREKCSAPDTLHSSLLPTGSPGRFDHPPGRGARPSGPAFFRSRRAAEAEHLSADGWEHSRRIAHPLAPSHAHDQWPDVIHAQASPRRGPTMRPPFRSSALGHVTVCVRPACAMSQAVRRRGAAPRSREVGKIRGLRVTQAALPPCISRFQPAALGDLRRVGLRLAHLLKTSPQRSDTHDWRPVRTPCRLSFSTSHDREPVAGPRLRAPARGSAGGST